jgi:tetratricopeptide (TPR) repeat protein
METSVVPGVAGAPAWAAKAEVLDPSGKTLRAVNGTLLREGVAVQTAALAGAARVRIQTRDGTIWESANVVGTHSMIGVWHRAGEALHMAADFTGAEKMYLKAIQIKPDAAESYITLGVAYLKMQRGREAEEAWRHSIRIDPRFQEGVAYLNLASEMKHRGRTAAMDSICQALAKVEPARELRVREALEKKHH